MKPNMVTLDSITFRYARIGQVGTDVRFRTLTRVDAVYEMQVGLAAMGGDTELTDDERTRLMALVSEIEQRIERELRESLA